MLRFRFWLLLGFALLTPTYGLHAQVLLLTANIARPARATLRMLLGVVKGEFADATEMEVRRELDYLESRELLKVFTDELGQVSADLTRHGIDVAEYTVPVDPGILRPPKG